jgi:hypothetical protein
MKKVTEKQTDTQTNRLLIVGGDRALTRDLTSRPSKRAIEIKDPQL